MNYRASANKTCRVCGKGLHSETLDMGSQPLCNRFLTNLTDDEYTHPLSLGVCPVCILPQIPQPPPAEEIAPHFPWIRYNEPEDHLDNLSDLIFDVAEKPEGCVAAGISYKDDTLLERLRRKGISGVWRIMPDQVGIIADKVEIETLQERLSELSAARIVKKCGYADILIARHIMEHAHDIGAFLSALKMLIKPDGLIVIEVPDCSRLLTMKDYSMLWEEHVFYFTPLNLRILLESKGFEIIHMENYPYSLENSLVVFVRPAKSGSILPIFGEDHEIELEHILEYFSAFPGEMEYYIQVLEDYKNQGKKIAMLGAGHHACMFVNIFGLKGYVECVLDDDVNRQGLFMPGSRLPVKPSSFLEYQKIQLCLLSLNPVNEKKVIARKQDFVNSGGKFMSIFPASQYAMKRL